MPRRRLAIVTGAGRGLGRLVTIELAAAGIDVLMVGRHRDALAQTASEAARTKGSKLYPLVCDLERATAAHTIMAAADARGGADILINNAAIQGPIGPFYEANHDDFVRTIATDFLVPAALMRLVLPGMLARAAGWIVNLSGGGATSPRPRFSAYGAAKVALVRLSETLAAEVAAGGVRVNSVAPGAFTSNMTRAISVSGDRAGAAEADLAAQMLRDNDDANAVKAAKLIAYLVAGLGQEITGKLISAQWDHWVDLHRHWDDLRDSDIYTLRRIVPKDRSRNWDE